MKKYKKLSFVLAAVTLMTLCACGTADKAASAGLSSQQSAEASEVSAPAPKAEIENVQVKKMLAEPLKNKACTISIDTILQNPELPTGCESVSLAMELNAIGFPTEKTELADSFMPCGSSFVTTFAGDPHKSSGMGIYPPGLVVTAQNYISGKKLDASAIDLTGLELAQLYKLIENGYPIVIWTTGGLHTPIPAKGAGSYEIVNGQKYTWYNNIHCIVLSGFDTEKQTVTVNDPLYKDARVYDAAQFESVYNNIDRMAMTVIKNQAQS